MLIPLAFLAALAQDSHRLTYLDEASPYYVHGKFPRLATPQWVGEEGVEAVVILSIDDMNGHERWEAYLRPILERLKKVDGRAPVSIMTCKIDPREPQLQAWLKEGLSLETHTVDHPHPILQGGDFSKAKSTYDRCVDTLAAVPGSRPVAFRMPWCDTENTPSPRFYAEIFNARTPKGDFLAIDSSVLNLMTPDDPELAREVAFGEDGKERFRRYLPAKGTFVNTVENYPYPYVIGRLCWEFPGAVPDDSQPWHRNNRQIDPKALEDLKLAIDATVRKQGVFTMIFHPYNWFRNDQIIELVDHAQAKHAGKVKFLNFREALERLERNLLGGASLRAADGSDNGVRLLDLDHDGYMDVVLGGARKTRVWKPKERRWVETSFPADPRAGRFGVLRTDGHASFIVRTEAVSGGWHFDGKDWVEDPALLRGLEVDGGPVLTSVGGRDRGVRIRGALLVSNESQNAAFGWTAEGWKRLSYALPPGTAIVDAWGRDAGLRFVDANRDGHEDVVFSDDERYAVHLFIPRPNALRAFPEMGWKRPVIRGNRGDSGEIPRIVRGGTDNGAWFAQGHLWVQNEDTARLPDLVDRRSFQELMVGWLPKPLSPEESIKAMRLDPRFTVELVASEPLVHDPVNFEWGHDGKLWVVEFSDYPAGIDGKGKPGGSVRFLEDADGDGKYDKSTLFLSGLNFPTGVMPWRKGVLVSAAPEILYAEDTDGDGKADLKKVLFSGFREGNQQHRVNGFQYGLDNWVYGANGGSGGTVAGVSINGRDFRFRPDDGRFEPQPGVTEFGRNRDDWGNWFGNNHPLWGWHYWLPEHYLARNPGLGARTNKRVMEESSLAFRISRMMARPQVARPLNFSTAPCCVMPYRDELFGPEFATSVFIGEVDKNLIHRQVLSPDGVSFRATRAPEEREREFLASTDNWFRPTMTKTGPDGALYVADMYRLVIEHIEYYPADVHDLIDFRAGHDKGRIYRIYPKGAALRTFPRLDDLPSLLESPNGWTRDTAQRLIVHAGGKSLAPAIEKRAASPRAKTRVQALWTLEGLGALAPETVKAALRDPDPRVREHAVKLSEAMIDRVGEALLPLVDDPEIRVRFQLAFTLGEWADARAGKALVRLADGPELRLAVLSSAPRHVASMLEAAPPQALLEPLLGLAAKDAKLGAAAMAKASEGPVDAAKMAAVAALREAGVVGGEAVAEHARRIAADAMAPEADRAVAVRLADLDLAGELLGPRVPMAVQQAALARVRSFREPKAADVLLAGWKTYPPALRAQALQAVLERKEWVPALLGSVESGRVAAGELDLAQRQRLLSIPELRERASKVFEAAGADRRKVLEEYKDVASLKGDPAKGLEHFRKNCASCHLVKGEGRVVGPDLSGYATKPPQDIVVAVIDPNQAIAGGFAGYLVETRDGRDLSGVISAETPTSITLRIAGGQEEVLLRSDIRSLRGSGLSLMPEGLEKTLRPQDLADLIAFIRANR